MVTRQLFSRILIIASFGMLLSGCDRIYTQPQLNCSDLPQVIVFDENLWKEYFDLKKKNHRRERKYISDHPEPFRLWATFSPELSIGRPFRSSNTMQLIEKHIDDLHCGQTSDEYLFIEEEGSGVFASVRYRSGVSCLFFEKHFTTCPLQWHEVPVLNIKYASRE